jgi:hypothetical protein
MPPIVRHATTNILVVLSLENTTRITTSMIRPRNRDFALTAKRVARAAGI